MSTSVDLLSPLAGGTPPPAVHGGSSPAAAGAKSVFSDLVAKHTATAAAMSPATAHAPSPLRGASPHDQSRTRLQDSPAPHAATDARSAPKTAAGVAGANGNTVRPSTAARRPRTGGSGTVPASVAVNAPQADSRAMSTSASDHRADAADDETGDDATTADRSASVAPSGATLPTLPLVSLTLAPRSTEAATAAPAAEGATDAVDASTVPQGDSPAPDSPGEGTDVTQPVAAATTVSASAQTAGPATDLFELAPDRTDESQDLPLTSAAQDTRAEVAPAEKGTATVTTTPAPATDAVDKSTKVILSQASGQAVSAGGKPVAAADSPSTASTPSGPTQKDPSAPSSASSVSSSSEQARAMLQAALGTRGDARQGSTPSPAAGTSSSMPNGAAVANPVGSSGTAPGLPVATVTARPTAPPAPPAPDDPASGAPTGSGHDSAALLSAAIARTQPSDGDSPGTSFGDARGRSNGGTSGGALAGASATLASGASPLGASFSLPLAASGQTGAAAGAQAPGLAPQTEATLPGQIVQAIRMQWQNGVGQATIHLDPAHLGELTVSLRVDQGTVSAQLHADTPEVRAWIQQHAHDLRGALEQQGLRLGQMTVAAVDPDGRRQQSAQEQPPPRAPRTAVDAGARFTVQA
jgi:flagellar hook-length control protein FliK